LFDIWEYLVGRTCCEDATLYNEWSKEGLRHVTCKAGRLELGQEPEVRWESKVLNLPEQRLGTRRTRGNQSIKESIQEVVLGKSKKERKSFRKGINSPLKYPEC
jgi:hypothetical protein